MPLPTSLYLELFRTIAASAVFFLHISTKDFTGGVLWQLGIFGQDAVMAFFILSGFVVAFSADHKHPTFSDFMIARLARLWSVALPAIILTLILDQLVRHLFDQSIPSNIRPPFSILEVVTSTFFMNQIWFIKLVPGTNLPFWSLSYEFFYYVAFAAAYYFRGRTRFAALVTVVAVAGPKILILAPIWLLGVVAYHLGKKQFPQVIGWTLWLGSWLLLTAFYALHMKARLDSLLPVAMPLHNGVINLAEIVRNYLFAFLIFINVVGFTIIGHRFLRMLKWNQEWIKGAARYSFSLYLYHFPLIIFFRSLTVSAFGEWWQILFMYGATLGCVFALGRVTEPRKVVITENMQRLMGLINIRTT